MKIEEIAKSKTFKIIISAISILIIALIIFKVGMFVGFKKAEFSCQWMKHYIPNFVRPQSNNKSDWMMEFNEKNTLKSHGTFGKIINLNINNDKNCELIVKEENDGEKIVLIKNDTLIEKMKKNIKPTDLNINDFIVVIGENNENGQIEAKLIRIIPNPPMDKMLLPNQKPF